MPSARIRRVNEAVREVVSTEITKGVKDPRVGFVTVTAVETSPDLRNATVFVSVLGDEQVRAETLDGLKASHGALQAVVNRELHIKHTPVLKFVYDESVDRGLRMDQLLSEQNYQPDND